MIGINVLLHIHQPFMTTMRVHITLIRTQLHYLLLNSSMITNIMIAPATTIVRASRYLVQPDITMLRYRKTYLVYR